MSARQAQPSVPAPSKARERIDQTADELFTRHGIRSVGVDTVVAHAGVAKMTLYRHYASKSDLAVAYLERRGEFARTWQREAERVSDTPGGTLLAVFDVLDKWFRGSDFTGCPVIRAMLESEEPDDAVRKASVEYMVSVRAYLQKLAAQAGVKNPAAVARDWQILMLGAIVAACAGDLSASRRMRGVGATLLEKNGIAVPARKRRKK